MTATHTETASNSRRRAREDRSPGGPPQGAAGNLPPVDVQRLIQELQVHQVELETQNDELRRAQAELEVARDAAQQANRAKSAFLANMSHEIRTPMSGIVGMLQLLGATPLEDGQRRYATLAATCAEELLCLIDGILDFSKIEAGKLELESAAFCPSSIVEGSLSVLEPAAQAKGIGLTCRIQHGVPRLLLGDPHRLRQVLVNLIGNAVKFTHQGRVTVVAEVRPARPGHCVLDISVADTGIGIPAQRRDRLFHNFSQGDDSTARAYGGTGLGLAISKQLVERMGGVIRVESEEGQGSVFGFAIPFAIATPPQAARAAAAAPLGELSTASPRRLRVLVAEDEPVNREVAVTYLEQRGWQVTAVADGKSALAALKTNPFDVVLMDVQMPGLDGFAATRLIREGQAPGQPRVPIIGLTAHALMGDRDKCLAAGMDDYLAKPVAPSVLCAAVERWAGSSRSPELPQEPPGGNPLAFLEARLAADQRATLRRTLVTSLTDSLDELKAARVRNDWPQTAFWAHRLKGSSAIFGFTAAADLAEQIDQQATASQPRGLNARVTALALEIERIETLLLPTPGPSTAL